MIIRYLILRINITKLWERGRLNYLINSLEMLLTLVAKIEMITECSFKFFLHDFLIRQKSQFK